MVFERQQMKQCTGPRHTPERICVAQTIPALAHYVKQPGVDDGFESCIPGHQFSSVRHKEFDFGAALARFDAGFLNRHGSPIDGDDAISLQSQVDCVLSSPAPSVENLSPNLASLHKILNKPSRAICIPRRARLPGVDFVECHGGVSNGEVMCV